MDRQYIVREKLNHTPNSQVLLDGLIVYSNELGELGKQLERLLRQGGAQSTMDPVYSMRCH